MTPRRAPSPTMSPGGRRGRMYASSDENRLRDLSPDTTLRAFTQKPLPFDTTSDEYKIFSCIESLTAAERDLGARVARAAQRLKSWCTEIEQWGWTGSFEPPSEEYREQRRKSLELRIREHVGDADLSNTLPPLEYWGSLLSVEVESHEARMDDIADDMLKLDVEELKEYVLDMHPSGRSRPSSAGLEASRQNYKPMDDFSFLITQTLLSALPHHAQLKERLSTWTARIATLRQVPRYLDDLETAQKAMQLGWDAIDPPKDTSDLAFAQWKEAVDTISAVLRGKIGDLGKRLDRMLDTLEGREDCIPDRWIDVFEGVETDYGRWAHESRRRVIAFDVQRRWEQNGLATQQRDATQMAEPHSSLAAPTQATSTVPISETCGNSKKLDDAPVLATPRGTEIFTSNSIPSLTIDRPVTSAYPTRSSLASPGADLLSTAKNATLSPRLDHEFTPEPSKATRDTAGGREAQRHGYANATQSIADVQVGTPEGSKYTSVSSPSTSTKKAKPWFFIDGPAPSPSDSITNKSATADSLPESREGQNGKSSPNWKQPVNTDSFESATESAPYPDEESDFDEGDTVIHNDLDDEVEIAEQASLSSSVSEAQYHDYGNDSNKTTVTRQKPSIILRENPSIIANDGQDELLQEPPQTPRLRRDSTSSISSDESFGSSPPGTLEESPSVRNATNRAMRAPRPELNAAMSKRRTAKAINDNGIINTPWPPTQFSQNSGNSAEDLERKISDILTTIPAHIRLTSGPGADAPEVKPRGVAAKGSRAYLRAARSVSGLKSPELTLSPAKNEYESASAISGRRSAAAARTDNDIKLYHLTQPGKEQPVKLFIRRVGENGERVMVRVGGGWADLGEYLRQYAEHHGRRTASEGKFEVLGLEVKNSDVMNSPTRSESVLSRQDRRFSGNYQAMSPTSTPVKSSGSGVETQSFGSTPGGEEGNAPSTTSSQRSWQGNEVGLAGPKAKKLDLSGDKLEWIEGMMKQARTVSGSVMPATHTPQERAESRSDSRSDSRTGSRKPEFGDLGKVGGTKRIFLRGGRPSLE